MSNPCFSIHCHSTCTLSRLSFSILLCHYLIWEVTFVEVKVDAIHWNQLGKKNRLILLLFRKRISKHEYSFLRGMSMEIHVHKEIFILTLLNEDLLDTFDCRMLYCIRSKVASIKVLSFRIKSVRTSVYSIRIHGWNHFENIVLKEVSWLRVLWVHK